MKINPFGPWHMVNTVNGYYVPPNVLIFRYVSAPVHADAPANTPKHTPFHMVSAQANRMWLNTFLIVRYLASNLTIRKDKRA